MSIDATGAARVLDHDFSTFDTAAHGGSTDDKISTNDLKAVAENKDGKYTAEQQETAQFLLDSTAARSAFDVGAGLHDVDGTIGRGDINAIMESIKNGTFDQRLLDTASGEGPLDQYVSSNDLDAALADPGVPEQVKDAIRLARYGAQDADLNDVLKNLTADGAAKASELYGSPEFNALPPSDQALVAQAFRDSNGDPAVTGDLLKQLQDPSFKALDAAQKTGKLNEFVLLHSPQFKALSPSDQKLITDALANRKPADAGLAASIRSLINSEDFRGLEPAGDAQTAVLSQVKNYHDSKAVSNLERLTALGWFQGMSLGDMQRTLKTIAHMSVYDNGGDRTTLDNTLEKLLDPKQGYSIEWTAQAPGVGAHSNPGKKLVSMNSADVLADNSAVIAKSSAEWQAVNALPHEINHAIDDVHVDTTYEYLDKEYQAYVTGNESQNGRPMTRKEAASTWLGLLDQNGIYAYASWGILRDKSGNVTSDTTGAMEDPKQAALICAELTRLTGVQVTAANYEQVLKDPGSWNPPEKAGQATPIPPDARPQGNLDNH